MSRIKISVIIPTFNRCQILVKTLTALNKQSFPLKEIEIIVVDDGSSDKTKDVANSFKQRQFVKTVYLSQEQKGPAAARNRGLSISNGRIILFLNDDSVPEKNLLMEHYRMHQQHSSINFAVLGQVKWPKRYLNTPFCQWWQERGPQFNHNQIKGKNAHWSQAWTANISYKKSFLPNNCFDVDFPYAAWEDIDLSYRLAKKGLILRYQPNAICWHHHRLTITDAVKKMKQNGAGAFLLGKKIGDNKWLPPLARSAPATICDCLDYIFVPHWLEKKWDKLMQVAEKRFKTGILFDLYLLHYRIKGRRIFIRCGQV